MGEYFTLTRLLGEIYHMSGISRQNVRGSNVLSVAVIIFYVKLHCSQFQFELGTLISRNFEMVLFEKLMVQD